MALDVPGTTGSLARYSKRGWRTALFGLVVVLLALVPIGFLADGANDEPAMTILRVAVVWGTMAVAVGLWVQVRALRLRCLLSRNPWHPRSFRIGPGGWNGLPGLLLAPNGAEPEAVLAIWTTGVRWLALDGGDEVWIAGNTRSRFAVAAPAGPGDLLIVKRPRVCWWARRLAYIAHDD